MLMKMGVDVSRLNRPVRRVLPVIGRFYMRWTEREAVITSTYEGTHSPGSLHYANDAVDFRKPDVYISDFAQSLQTILGPDFDVLMEKTHLHVEYDPKGG